MKLQVLICTTAKRLAAIDAVGLPVVDGVEYIVSCQNPERIDLESASRTLIGERRDITIHFFENRGLSRNRNNAFSVASAQYLYIADDDISFSPDGLRQVINRFEADSSLDIICTRAEMPESRVYPPDGHDLNIPFRFYWIVSFEIALRRSAVEQSGLRFSELAGIGAPYLTAGEEEIFIESALRHGLKGRFADIVVAHHPALTTGVRDGAKPGVIRAKGAFMWLKRGALASILRIPIEAYRAPVAFFKALLWLAQGAAYAVKHRKELGL